MFYKREVEPFGLSSKSVEVNILVDSEAPRTKIVVYRDLDDKDKLLPVLHLAFGWPFNEKQFEEDIAIDKRLNAGPIGFCAVENDRVVGFVGVVEVHTRNLEGEIEACGGLFGVSTLPSHAKMGISTSLMKEAHRYFNEKDYRFSFLTTRRVWVAYDLYVKLGYEDAVQYPNAYKVLSSNIGSTDKEDEKVDLRRLVDIYNAFSLERTGFVVRDEDYFKMLIRHGAVEHGGKPESVVVGDKGYALYNRESNLLLCIDEVITRSGQEARNLIQRIESQACRAVYDRIVLDNKLLGIYKSMSYLTQNISHLLLMVKRLTGLATFSEVYGKKFHVNNLDIF